MFTNLRLAFEGLNANKMRSALTMLGILIGVAVVILLVSLGQAVESFIMAQFSMLGSDLVYVFGELEDSYGRTTWLTMSDAEALADPYRVPDAVALMPVFEFSGIDAYPISYRSRSTRVNLHGATPLWRDMVNQTVVEGRFITEQDVISGAGGAAGADCRH
jgi:putative ABC transport system permease protein